jgi:hypothetical protein
LGCFLWWAGLVLGLVDVVTVGLRRLLAWPGKVSALFFLLKFSVFIFWFEFGI